MQIHRLGELACPACHGELGVATSLVAPAFLDGDDGELLEGMLRCAGCDTMYPVLFGAAALVRQPMTWLAHSYATISSLAARTPLGPAMRAYLDRECYDLVQVPGHRYYDAPATIGTYVAAHYDRVSELASFVSQRCAPGIAEHAQLADVVTRMLRAALPSRVARALDVGANVGGMTRRLTEFADTVWGVDLSLGPVHTARRILLRRPTPLDAYPFRIDGRTIIDRPLDVPAQVGVELAVASGLELPFADRSFDLVHCANVVDMVADPAALVRELGRVLAPGGVLLQTDPYAWRAERTSIESWPEGDDGDSTSGMRALLTAEGLEIVAEEDGVPWVMPDTGRLFNILLNHCVVARRTRAGFAEGGRRSDGERDPASR